MLCIFLGAFIAEFALRPPRRLLDPTAVAQFTDELRKNSESLQEVSVSARDGTVLRGWVVRPATSNGRAVLVLHGVADNRLGGVGIAKVYLRNGYTALLADSRAQGISGGDFATYGVLERYDIAAWTDWAIRNEHVNCVYGHGGSMGAALVLQALAVERRFCAVIAESPFASFREISYDRIGQRFGAGAWLGRSVFRPVVEGALLWTRVRHDLALAGASPAAAVAASHVPVFIIDGAADDNIPPRHTDLILADHPPNVTTWRVLHAGHGGLWSAAGDEFPRRILAFMAAH